ncbi:MAG: HD domain-containing protein [Gammaproteobacteria bacterium]
MLEIDGVAVPDTQIANEVTELVRDIASPLLFNHSSRVYYFAALAGQRRKLRFDAELVYVGAMFHDMGLTARHSSQTERFEVDGADAARDFLRQHHIAQEDIDTVWTAIALHTTPGIPKHMHPVVALVAAGVQMDVVGIGYDETTETQRNSVAQAFPRNSSFEEEIIQTFYDWNKHKPETTYGTINADILADKDSSFRRIDVCSRIRRSRWKVGS